MTHRDNESTVKKVYHNFIKMYVLDASYGGYYVDELASKTYIKDIGSMKPPLACKIKILHYGFSLCVNLISFNRRFTVKNEILIELSR